MVVCLSLVVFSSSTRNLELLVRCPSRCLQCFLSTFKPQGNAAVTTVKQTVHDDCCHSIHYFSNPYLHLLLYPQNLSLLLSLRATIPRASLPISPQPLKSSCSYFLHWYERKKPILSLLREVLTIIFILCISTTPSSIWCGAMSIAPTRCLA